MMMKLAARAITTKRRPISRIFHILKIKQMMSFCNFDMFLNWNTLLRSSKCPRHVARRPRHTVAIKTNHSHSLL